MAFQVNKSPHGFPYTLVHVLIVIHKQVTIITMQNSDQCRPYTSYQGIEAYCTYQ